MVRGCVASRTMRFHSYHGPSERFRYEVHYKALLCRNSTLSNRVNQDKLVTAKPKLATGRRAM